MNIKNDKINFSAKSMIDDFGRIFFMDNKIYRAIHNSKKEYCVSLINSELIHELQKKEYIPKTTVADFSIDGYDLILEHEKLTETLQHEWSFSMLKDAALLVTEVNEVCNKYGFELKDAHTMNVLFKGVKPMWVDIGSISQRNKLELSNWTAYSEFLGSFVIPLIFWSEKKIYVTRKLLESIFYRIELLPVQNILESNLLSLLSLNVSQYKLVFRGSPLFITTHKRKLIDLLSSQINKLLNFVTSRKNHQFFSYNIEYLPYEKIKTLIKNLSAPSMDSSWQNYHDHYYSNNGQLSSSNRFSRIIELIRSREGEINSVIDLAGNQGLLCDMIREETGIEKIVLTDYDANAIDFAYNIFKNKSIDSINLLLLNFMFTQDVPGTAKRIKSDLAMALAVTHHLVLSSLYSIDAIFERIKLYSNKFVMIEFMPLGLWAFGSTTYPELPGWYNEEWFKCAFEKYFVLIKKEKLEENRILYFGEIIP